MKVKVETGFIHNHRATVPGEVLEMDDRVAFLKIASGQVSKVAEAPADASKPKPSASPASPQKP